MLRPLVPQVPGVPQVPEVQVPDVPGVRVPDVPGSGIPSLHPWNAEPPQPEPVERRNLGKPHMSMRIEVGAIALGILAAVGLTAQGRYVHLDRDTGDINISFPERLGAPDFENDPGPTRTVSLVLPNRSFPVV